MQSFYGMLKCELCSELFVAVEHISHISHIGCLEYGRVWSEKC